MAQSRFLFKAQILCISAVSDTLEPVKVYQQRNANFSAQAIADAIDIKYTPGTHRLRFSSRSEEVNIAILHQKARGLMEWTAADCSDIKNGAFTLKI